MGPSGICWCRKPAAGETMAQGRGRCFGDDDVLLGAYHDREWGVPVRDARGLYERLCLEAFQAGLSWRVVLHKRGALRAAFCDFDPERVAVFGARDVARLLRDARIIRNRAKIEAAVTNARATLALEERGAGLAALVWSFAPRRPPAPRSWSRVPAVTPQSRALSQALQRAGYCFVGPTTAYATMQAAGLVNDHLVGCARRKPVALERAEALRALASDYR